jgi:hypothetical protein
MALSEAGKKELSQSDGELPKAKKVRIASRLSASHQLLDEGSLGFTTWKVVQGLYTLLIGTPRGMRHPAASISGFAKTIALNALRGEPV